MQTCARPSTTFAKNRDVNIAYSVFGNGRALVLLHGFSLSRHTWSELGYIAPLVEGGHQLIAIDLRGHGDSSKPHDPAAYLADKEASDVKAVLDSVGVERASLWGYSRGGRVALEFAVLHPNRVHKLVVGGAHPFAQDMSLYRNAVARGMQGWIDVVEHATGSLPTSIKSQISQNDVEALRAAVAKDRLDISGQFSDLDCSCLFYAGSKDAMCDESVRSARLVRQGEAVQLNKCNHMSAFLRSDLILPHMVRFLAQPLVF
jgi:pimeloyl-ACP methyl ester carboxylesterase